MNEKMKIMETADIQSQIMEELRLIPKDRLPELYDFIHFFRLGLEAVKDDTEEIMRFSGCWQDMTQREFEDFSEEIAERRRQAFSRRADKPVQQFAYTTGKNATDSMLIIDAMDLLYTRKFDGFCLVTSDSDFTGLAMRLREEGITVLGFGEAKTPEAFRNACHKFISTEIFRPPDQTKCVISLAKSEASEKQTEASAPSVHPKPEHDFPKKLVLDALEHSSDEEGWANLGTFGSYPTKVQSDFDPRMFGYKKLSELVKAKTDIFITQERSVEGTTQKVLYVRAK
jgi:hypothetical protein